MTVFVEVRATDLALGHKTHLIGGKPHWTTKFYPTIHIEASLKVCPQHVMQVDRFATF